MKTIFKLGLVGLALAAATAHADVAPPSSGNGELTLFVRNDTTGFVYARGLVLTLNDLLTQTQIDGVFEGDTLTGLTHQLGYALPTFAADANLTGFLSNTEHSYSWTIMAGDSSGSNNASPDARRYLTTTPLLYGDPELDPTATINIVTNNNLVTFSSLNTLIGQVNSAIPGETIGDGGSTAVNGQWRQTGAQPGFAAGNWFGAGPSNVNQLGESAHLYILTTAGGGNGGTVRTYQAFDVVLNSDGTLSAIVPPAVPLPPAVWMLVSGLLTLAGVARRKREGHATPAAA